MDAIIVFPGQGSQKVGMAQDLAAAFPAAAAALSAIDAALDEAITPLMWDGPEDTLKLTLNAQPALLAHSAAVWAVVGERLAPHVRAAAGHSLGEFSAYVAAGAIAAPEAAGLVRRRGELMYAAGQQRPGGMAALLGTLTQPVEALCETVAEGEVIVPANFNADEQVVISGEVAALERAMALAKEAGAKRALRLPVSGAFHSPLMAPAVDGLTEALQALPWAPAAFPVYANVDAAPRRGVDEARAALRAQLTAPVRWTAVVRAMAAAHPGAVWIELGTGSVLGGLIKRLVPGAEVLACGTEGEVRTLMERLA